jgi:uracil-DNA glycosylase
MSLFNLENVLPSWKVIIENLLNEDLYQQINKPRVFPPKDQIFETFKYFQLQDTKCVIIGQDPYHQFGQAHGLSFSVQDHVSHPPSLKNIIKELNLEYPDSGKTRSGNLIDWVQQGVLMLNSALTVPESKPNQHQSLWSPITTKIINELSKQHPGGCIFMLWGNDAKKYKKIIDQEKHHILEANHPSPLSANRGGWFGNNHFIRTNKILQENGKKIIEWL